MIIDAIKQAMNMHRKALEETYEGVCTVIEYHDVQNEKTKITSQEEVIVIANQPCKLAFNRLAATIQTETAAAISQSVKLFLAPEILIRENSKIVVTQDGVTQEYGASGPPAIYSTHQEVPLELFRGWS